MTFKRKSKQQLKFFFPPCELSMWTSPKLAGLRIRLDSHCLEMVNSPRSECLMTLSYCLWTSMVHLHRRTQMNHVSGVVEDLHSLMAQLQSMSKGQSTGVRFMSPCRRLPLVKSGWFTQNIPSDSFSLPSCAPSSSSRLEYKRWLSRQLGRQRESVNHIKESVSGTLWKICAGQGGIECEASVCVCVGQRHEWMPSHERAALLTRLLRQLVCRQQRGCLQHAFVIQQNLEASNPSVFVRRRGNRRKILGSFRLHRSASCD